MLRIRLARVGRKHDPSYRVIVTERGRAPQPGNYVEQVGTYDARSDEHDLKPERIEHWISNGAQPSETVHNLLVKAGVIEGDTTNPLPKKSPIKKEGGSDEEPKSETDSSEPDEEEAGEDTEEDSSTTEEEVEDDEVEQEDEESEEPQEEGEEGEEDEENQDAS